MFLNDDATETGAMEHCVSENGSWTLSKEFCTVCIYLFSKKNLQTLCESLPLVLNASATGE